MNKKSVSALVATVLLILVTVACIGIIWGAIMPMLQDGTEKAQQQIEKENQTQNLKDLQDAYARYSQGVIDICRKNCGELGLDYFKVLDDIPYRTYGCYCINPDSCGDVIVRIW